MDRHAPHQLYRRKQIHQRISRVSQKDHISSDENRFFSVQGIPNALLRTMSGNWLSRARQLLNLPQHSLVQMILEKESGLNAEQISNVMMQVVDRSIAGKELSDGLPRKVRKVEVHKKFDFSNCRFGFIAFKVLYFGKNYLGVAIQKCTENTIQQKILDALEKTCLIPSEDERKDIFSWSLCGRTDRGVSAFGNVVIAKVRRSEGNEDFDYCKILNNVLPNDIRVIGWADADSPVFDAKTNIMRTISARFDCQFREYKYVLFADDLDVEAMKSAAQDLIGEHDFRNLCKIDLSATQNFRRRILSVDISPYENEGCKDVRNRLVVVSIQGYAFLYHQIRCIIAVLIQVGRGNESCDIIKELLNVEKNPRKPEYEMAHETPLILWDCSFPQLDFKISNVAKSKLETELTLHWRSLYMESVLWQMAHQRIYDSLYCNLDQISQLGLLQKKPHTRLLNRKLGPTLEELMQKHALSSKSTTTESDPE
jgi:tRNA pseudouridine38/39 synthase